MTAAAEKPTLAVLHYKGNRWGDALVPVTTPDLRLIDVAPPQLMHSAYGSRREKEQSLLKFRAWAAAQPHAIVRVVKGYMEDPTPYSELEKAAVQSLKNQLHRRNPVPNPAHPFVVCLEESGHKRYLAGSADVQIVHIDVADLRSPSRVGHAEAARKAEQLPNSVKSQIRERFRSASSVLAPSPRPDRGLGE